MAKRFTDTNKYKKPFIRGLQGAYKLLWDYLYHDCDHAGIWIVDFDIAQVYLGADMPVNRADALKFFNKDEVRIIEIDKGSKWFIVPFIEFQYGELNEQNRAHNSVIQILRKYKLYKNKPLTSPFKGAMDMDKDKDKDMDMVKDMDLQNPEFEEVFVIWLRYKRSKGQAYKNKDSCTIAFKKLYELSGGNIQKAKDIIEQSIANNYAGLFELKQQKPTSSNSNDDRREKLQQLQQNALDVLKYASNS